jgi:hypothetical protein
MVFIVRTVKFQNLCLMSSTSTALSNFSMLFYAATGKTTKNFELLA